MLLDDDVVTDREAKARPLASRLVVKNGLKSFPHCGWNASAVVPYPDFNTVAQVLGQAARVGS